MSNNNMISILGSEHSGTSLLTNILVELGMKLSNNLVARTAQNPCGGFEDKTIMQYQREMLLLLGSDGNLPLSEDFLSTDGVENAKEQLTTYIKERVDSATTIWGFKDPKTVTLLPLWTRIYGSIKLAPRYILTIRNPTSVINSMASQHGQDKRVSEIFWLTKNIDALRHTGGNVFIVHYEDWFTAKAPKVAKELLEFTGLDRFFTGDVHDVIESLVKPNQNRSPWENYEVKNRCVNKLYKALQECHGAYFNQTKLMPIVLECRETMDEFMGWPIAAHKLLKGKEAQIKRLEQRDNSAEELKSLVKENNTLLKKNIRLAEQVANLKILQQKMPNNTRKFLVTEETYRYRLGNIFVAVAKRESNLVTIPWKLTTLMWDIITGRGRKKQSL